ncbi:MAG: DUF4013 domain-containing protein [Chloroflexota bacterium]|nr:DUF4013 domain-containing protein [Chloroflexota bacterium]MDE2908295.1 DUF4013 domain-containing protein [Chloroflexota bacterium]
MNFSSAFKYPFRNFAKVMSIVLAMTIAFSVFFAMILNSYDWATLLAELFGHDLPGSSAGTLQPLGGTTIAGIVGLLLVAVVSGFWTSGYSVEVVRAVLREQEWMPAVDFGRNVKDGAYLFAASLAYWALFIALIVVLAVFGGLIGEIVEFARPVVAIGSIVCVTGAAFVMGWGYFVGMARFAAEGDHKASWRIWENMRFAWSNWQKGARLALYMIAFSIIYGIARQIVDGVFGGLMGANLFAGFTLSIIIYYIFNLMQHFSTQHLIAQYAEEIGLGGDRYNPGKDKVGVV